MQETTPMKIVLTICASLALLYAGPILAQSSSSVAGSAASSEVDVTTGAIAGSQINNYGQKPGEDNRVYQEVATAPSLGGLALGGGHPCAYSPATFQVSVIGSGAGAGGMKVDSACMLMVMGAAGDAKAYKAAQLMLAARDPAACSAMEAAGLVDCTTKEERRAAAKKDWSKPVAASSKSAGTNTGWGAKCEKVGNTIKFRPTTQEARNAELSACKARFKLR
jgi:hypothetical protein